MEQERQRLTLDTNGTETLDELAERYISAAFGDVEQSEIEIITARRKGL
jgi:hypothetical protein